MKIELYCRCGAGAKGDVSHGAPAEKFRAIWYSKHQGPTHGDFTEEEAVAAFKAAHGNDPRH